MLTRRGRFEVIHTADPAEALRLAAAEHWDATATALIGQGRKPATDVGL